MTEDQVQQVIAALGSGAQVIAQEIVMKNFILAFACLLIGFFMSWLWRREPENDYAGPACMVAIACYFASLVFFLLAAKALVMPNITAINYVSGILK